MAQIIPFPTPEKEFPVLFYLNAAEYEAIMHMNDEIENDMDIEVLTPANRNEHL